MKANYQGQEFEGEPVFQASATAQGGWIFTGLRQGRAVYFAATDGRLLIANNPDGWLDARHFTDFRPFTAFLKWPF